MTEKIVLDADDMLLVWEQALLNYVCSMKPIIITSPARKNGFFYKLWSENNG
jgi:hypothetical protein